MEVVAIILARAGSKGIPGKNLKTVGGLSLVARAIKFAQTRCSRVIVSSDGLEILAESASFGAVPLRRPAHLSGDLESSESVISHVIKELALEKSIVVFIQATSPFQDSDAMKNAVELVSTGAYDSVFSATASHSFIWTQEDGDAAVPLLEGSNPRLRRQDLKPRFQETGGFYVFKADAFLNSGSRFHGRVGLVNTNPLSTIDIDDWKDLDFAKKIAEIEGIHSKQLVSLNPKLIAYDFDGVMTNNKAIVSQDGSESVVIDRSDGLAISEIRKLGIEQVIISTESNPVVSIRARKLDIPVIQGSADKQLALETYCRDKSISITETVFVGNDVNDLSAMACVGFVACPSDAAPEVKRIANLVLSSPGGEGAVRELFTYLHTERLG